jgi:hypothetical protein
MSYISGTRLQTIDDAQENASWCGEAASGRRIYASVQNDPLHRTDPLGLCDNPQGVRAPTTTSTTPVEHPA